MSIVLEGSNIEATFTATADTLIQNNELAEVSFQTDNLEATWGKIKIGDSVKIATGTIIYFKSSGKGNLATIEV